MDAMNYYRNTFGEVFSFDDRQVSSGIVADGLVAMTDDEIQNHLNKSYEISIPYRVTRGQGKAALLSAGLWPDVLKYVLSIEDETHRTLTEIAMHDTTHWERSSPFLNTVSNAIGLSSKQLDDLFIQAAAIKL